MYRLFIDEVGHDSLASINDPNEQHLCLMGVALDLDYANGEFSDALNALKLAIFETGNVVLHRREIIDKNIEPFNLLRDASRRNAFDEALLRWLTDSRYTALAVIIDKKEHFDRYKVWRSHPYHYCLMAMLERYVMWLESKGPNAVGDVMAEWRGPKPNRRLEEAYKRLYRNGTDNVSPKQFQTCLSSNSLKIQKKTANVAGLQLADMLASPVSRSLICRKQRVPMIAPFGKKVVNMLIETKFRRGGYKQQILGYGVKYLP